LMPSPMEPTENGKVGPLQDGSTPTLEEIHRAGREIMIQAMREVGEKAREAPRRGVPLHEIIDEP
jgi:hypothetical protein